jgi:hypothetical protein
LKHKIQACTNVKHSTLPVARLLLLPSCGYRKVPVLTKFGCKALPVAKLLWLQNSYSCENACLSEVTTAAKLLLLSVLYYFKILLLLQSSNYIVLQLLCFKTHHFHIHLEYHFFTHVIICSINCWSSNINKLVWFIFLTNTYYVHFKWIYLFGNCEVVLILKKM